MSTTEMALMALALFAIAAFALIRARGSARGRRRVWRRRVDRYEPIDITVAPKPETPPL